MISGKVEAHLDVIDHDDHHETIHAEVLEGLLRKQKALPAKYFYDEHGSRLFDEITALDDYYPTRTELSILKHNVGALATLVGPHAVLVEYGSGNSSKTRILISRLALSAYIPVDISRTHLEAAAARLAASFPDLPILPVHADYTQDYTLPDIPKDARRIVVFFPGSTIGNFRPDDAILFLQNVAAHCGTSGGLIIGVDLKKDRAVLEAAYNDRRGVTAAFNLNMLTRLNRELDGDFDVGQFDHRAIYNTREGRIEMHLVSLAEQVVHLDDVAIPFRKGEYIHTENSYKYTLDEFADLAADAGFAVSAVWTDPGRLFSVQFLTVR